ncbi:tumor necrosis factor receptor superfamily member 5-like isoform X2 [Carcharodon carcharias]|uniref:tumor necrosis factor receptor superfamily member 5-like isoform X2 n=1 Tax=Carcharodon carcharias TaxID=13397 RepID=UPI001B7E31AB|nr:tumor necrosis factor receptor superfamily member 5-like isoform X2 [Carcharodon carcharias]
MKFYFLWMYFMLISYRQEVKCCQQSQFLYNGNCCDMCPAGTQLVAYCGATLQTECRRCRTGTFTDQMHNLRACYHCLSCHGGTDTTDITCEQCPPGSYSDTPTITRKCMPITDCRALGMVVTVGATKAKNAKCIYAEAIVIPLVVLAISSAAGVIFWNGQWVRCEGNSEHDGSDIIQDEIEKQEKTVESKKESQPAIDEQTQTKRESISTEQSSYNMEEEQTELRPFPTSNMIMMQ